jgi:hypothetical protein
VHNLGRRHWAWWSPSFARTKEEHCRQDVEGV